ncbi:hypothetical protein PNOK_0973200 [Pyrrhoderma noxium]|uniref:BTB domain-containing protein n=1 Tax=Pyrrhoderma noxium TaxID=2282107 RepID=A0A286U508_9AGAM|nr:hypothetical protein PNOK_0973200 [Pyrrhoderma noxium]
MAYTRAPPSFQALYFSFRSPPIASPFPFGTSPTPYPSMPATSVLSPNPDVDFSYNASVRSVSPSNFRPTSPAPSVISSLTRISLNHNPALFSNELEYLYTGKVFGDAFEFLFDANEKNGSECGADEARIAKVHVPTIGNSTTTEEETAPAFYSHRFILATRAPYFYDQLITYGLKNLPPPGEPAKLRLHSPPFTAPALHFTLGFLYTGTLAF